MVLLFSREKTGEIVEESCVVCLKVEMLVLSAVYVSDLKVEITCKNLDLGLLKYGGS